MKKAYIIPKVETVRVLPVNMTASSPIIQNNDAGTDINGDYNDVKFNAGWDIWGAGDDFDEDF